MLLPLFTARKMSPPSPLSQGLRDSAVKPEPVDTTTGLRLPAISKTMTNRQPGDVDGRQHASFFLPVDDPAAAGLKASSSRRIAVVAAPLEEAGTRKHVTLTRCRCFSHHHHHHQVHREIRRTYVLLCVRQSTSSPVPLGLRRNFDGRPFNE